MTVAGVVLGAGAGSRLRPMTDHLAKPLMPVLDRPLVSYALERMVEAGVEQIFVNLHHHADQMRAALSRESCADRIVTRLEPRLSGPAGALRAFAAELADHDAVLVASGDVLATGGLSELLAHHRAAGADLTVAVRHRQRAGRYGVLDIDDRGAIIGAREKPPVPDDEWHWISAGIYCLSPALVRDFPADGIYDYAADLVPDLLARGRPVAAFPLPGYWRDVGTSRSLYQANIDAASGGVHLGLGVELMDGVELRGTVVVGAGARIGAGVWLEDTVVLPGATVAAGSVLTGALVGTLVGPVPQASGSNREGHPS